MMTDRYANRSLEAVLDRLLDRATKEENPSFRALVEAAGLVPDQDFVGARLREMDFRDEDLCGFNFSNADLTGADFRRANVYGLRLDGADLTGVIGLREERDQPPPAFVADLNLGPEPPRRSDTQGDAAATPQVTAEEPRLKPFIVLAEKLGSFAGQLTETGLKKVQIAYDGHVAKMNTRALTSAVVAGLLRPMLPDVNFVSALVSAKERGIVVEELTRDAAGDYESLITVTVVTERMTRGVSGTVFADGRPRIVNIKGIRMDAEFGPSMLYVTNVDKPGFIGRFASLLGDAQINIATFNLGRDTAGGNAIALVEIDGEIPDDLLEEVMALPHVQNAKRLHF
jgi:hypothetical protein